MKKRILITGATDGIGLETARMLGALGHDLLLHGRNQTKLGKVQEMLQQSGAEGALSSYVADLSKLNEVEALAEKINSEQTSLDVLINNAGVLGVSETQTQTEDGLDIRFVVNTFAPYLLTQKLLPSMNSEGRVVNLSSAAQSPIDPDAISGKLTLSDFEMYAQSKLAITMWSRQMAQSMKNATDERDISVVAVNPGSLLASKMVKDAFGVEGKDIRIGADVLVRAALSDEFEEASGLYFDNDAGQFGPPHSDALDPEKCNDVVQTIEAILSHRKPA